MKNKGKNLKTVS